MTHSTEYVLVPGVLVEPLGDHWAAFSPSSGESHLINDTSAAILEMLGGGAPLTPAQICTELTAHVGAVAVDAQGLVGDAFRAFITAGLVRTAPVLADSSP